MSGARDRFDTGKGIAAAKLDRLREFVRQGTQRECESHTIREAGRAAANGTASPFALDLLVELAITQAVERGS
jgi:hypothetical protein